MKRTLIFALPLVLTIALFALFASQINRDPDLLPSALMNKPAPEFTLQPVEGHDQPGFSSADLKGQLSLVNVWASWCVPCREEHEFLMRLAERDDIKLFGINYNDQPENARDFLRKLGNPFDAVGDDRNRRVSLEWGVYGVPESYLVNKDGVIVYKHTGPMSEDSFQNKVLPAIAKALEAQEAS
ncbi:DsbE family thiol:disulfide interchange protein [Maritalea myrionectae]|uniref:DsbE family thiol:disulfide interchange protein n=1 Tax=Maritalea myrionectae TaxID=454601 RepID=UPI00041633B9|nr:DsbE family thiol:disulfide interchange protein [Maritalea myrionectae]